MVVPDLDSALPSALPSAQGAEAAPSRPVPSPTGGRSQTGPSPAAGDAAAPVPAAPSAAAATGCQTVSGRAVNTSGAPLADLVVTRVRRDGDGTGIEVAARTGGDGTFTVPTGGALMLSPTAPGAAQDGSTKNLVPVWVGGATSPAVTGCGAAGDTVVPAGATLVGSYLTPPDGDQARPDSLTLRVAAAGTPLAVVPAVAFLDQDSYRLVGLPAVTGATLRDALTHERDVDLGVGPNREDWVACLTCTDGRATRGGAAQVDPTDPPALPTDPPTPTGTPTSSPPEPAPLPPPGWKPTVAPAPTGPPDRPRAD